VTATELWEAFRDNEAEAEHRFAHRPLYVAGAVEEVRRHGAAYALRLSVSGRFTATVSCHLSDDRRFNLRGLRPGALILVLGRRVFMQYGAVVVDDALVLEDDLAAHFRSAVS
jgi:alpha-galactosidase